LVLKKTTRRLPLGKRTMLHYTCPCAGSTRWRAPRDNQMVFTAWRSRS